MRVNPNMISDVVAAIQKTQQQEQTAIEQITTGKRVNSPSDDPAAAAAMVTSMDQAGRLDQYTQNVSSLQSMLQTVDSSLSAVTTSLNQAISIGTEGGNGTLTSEQRQTLANQVNGILATVVSQANLSYQGVYLFGGTNTTQAPFSTPTTSGSPYTYNGNLDTNSVPVNDGLSLTVNVPGEDIFQNPQGDVLGSLQSLSSALQSGSTGDIAHATSAVNDALNLVGQQRTFYGNVMSQLNSQETFLQQETVNIQSQQNTLVGADTATAATELVQAATANNAALAAAARVLPNTLLDYLK